MQKGPSQALFNISRLSFQFFIHFMKHSEWVMTWFEGQKLFAWDISIFEPGAQPKMLLQLSAKVVPPTSPPPLWIDLKKKKQLDIFSFDWPYHIRDFVFHLEVDVGTWKTTLYWKIYFRSLTKVWFSHNSVTVVLHQSIQQFRPGTSKE